MATTVGYREARAWLLQQPASAERDAVVMYLDETNRDLKATLDRGLSRSAHVNALKALVRLLGKGAAEDVEKVLDGLDRAVWVVRSQVEPPE